MTSWRMQPTTASALGVIAVVSVMISVTATAESNTMDRGTNRPASKNEDGHYQEEEKLESYRNTSNSFSNWSVILFQRNDTNNDLEFSREIYVSTDRLDSMNVTTFETSMDIVEVQKDQSDDRVAVLFNDVETVLERTNILAGSNEKSLENGSLKEKLANEKATETYKQVSIVPTTEETEISLKLEVGENQMVPSAKKIAELGSVQVNVDGLSMSIDREDDPMITSSSHGRLEEDDPSTGSPKNPAEGAITLATEFQSISQKNFKDIKAISFQVPQQAVAGGKVDDDRKMSEDSLRVGSLEKPIESKSEHSKGLTNNLLPGKSTKAFYEIKPSIKTEMEKPLNRQVTLSTQKISPGRKFLLPSVDSAIGKYGPYFEDGGQETNITARIGSTVLLDCRIGMLGDKEVTWFQHSKDSFRLLTVGKTLYSNDQRISLNFRYPSNWRLQILFASPRDSGLYKCQIATHPPLIKEINVIVTAPKLTITDDSGRIVPKERHLKAGSALKLRCEARDVLESLQESVLWTRGDETLMEDVSENRTAEFSEGKEVLVIVSTLTVEKATPRHAGNYSCVVPGKAKTSIAVHVLNGELPAAVHDGNGVSRAFLNLWLIHLTMSYVFSR